jgi:hypothetical protein
MMKSEIRNGKKRRKKMIKKLQSRRQRNKEVRYERVKRKGECVLLNLHRGVENV